MPSSQRILFVINPAAGIGGKDRWEAGITAYFRVSPHQYEWYEMQGNASDEASLKYWMENWRPDRVVAVGGDGTLKFVAENLLHTGIAVGFLPAGSANGMARELQLPKSPEDILHLAVEGGTRAMDVVCINGHYSLHLADLGLNAKLVKYFEQSGRRGMWGYAREVWRVIRSRQQLALELTVDSKKLKRTAWMAVLANARLYGTGATINPDGDLFDGKFEVVLLKKMWVWELFRMLLKNKRFSRQRTEIIHASDITIRVEGDAHFQVDGEYVGKTEEVTAHIERGAVQMVVPA